MRYPRPMNLTALIPSRLPLLQAPMAGAQGSALALAVCAAGGVGGLPAAMLAPEALRAELQLLRAQAHGPWNVNFFCHNPPAPDAAAEARWQAAPPAPSTPPPTYGSSQPKYYKQKKSFLHELFD